MAIGKQGGMAKAQTGPVMPGKKYGGGTPGGGNVKKGTHVKGISGNSKKIK
jgi:hypothetical protein